GTTASVGKPGHAGSGRVNAPDVALASSNVPHPTKKNRMQSRWSALVCGRMLTPRFGANATVGWRAVNRVLVLSVVIVASAVWAGCGIPGRTRGSADGDAGRFDAGRPVSTDAGPRPEPMLLFDAGPLPDGGPWPSEPTWSSRR